MDLCDRSRRAHKSNDSPGTAKRLLNQFLGQSMAGCLEILQQRLHRRNQITPASDKKDTHGTDHLELEPLRHRAAELLVDQDTVPTLRGKGDRCRLAETIARASGRSG